MPKKVRILPVIILILFSCVLVINQNITAYTKALAQDVSADNYYNPEKSTRWENPSLIKVYIEDNSDKSYLMKRAFYIWNNELNLFNFYFVNDEDKADIVCKFIYKIGDAIAGVTNHPKGIKIVTYDNGKIEKFFIKVNITIAYSNDTVGKFNNDHQYYLTVLLHEIGHALGITGYHSDNPNDVMYPESSAIKNKGMLSQRDINTIKMIYSK